MSFLEFPKSFPIILIHYIVRPSMEQRSLVLLGILMCLFCGTLIYATTRSESIYLNQFLVQVAGRDILSSLQSVVENSRIPRWIIYSLPDALWMWTLTILVLLIWDFKLHRKSILWVAGAVLAGILLEVLQGFNIGYGTFDVTDLVLILIAAFIPVSFIILKQLTCKTS